MMCVNQDPKDIPITYQHEGSLFVITKAGRCLFSVDLSWLSAEISAAYGWRSSLSIEALKKSLNDSLGRYTQRQMIVEDLESQIFDICVASKEVMFVIKSTTKYPPRLESHDIKNSMVSDYDPDMLKQLNGKKIDLSIKPYKEDYPPGSLFKTVQAVKDLDQVVSELKSLQTSLNITLDAPKLKEPYLKELGELQSKYSKVVTLAEEHARLAKEQHKRNCTVHQTSYFQMQETQALLEAQQKQLKDKIMKINTKNSELSEKTKKVLQNLHLLGMTDEHLERIESQLELKSSRVDTIQQNVQQVDKI